MKPGPFVHWAVTPKSSARFSSWAFVVSPSAVYNRLELKTTGMEFASEMIIKATIKSLRITETPITLHKDGRSPSAAFEALA